jgi:hypothetical protein
MALQTAESVVDLARKEICKDLGILPGSQPKTLAAGMPKPRDINRPFDPAPGTALYEDQFNELAEIYEIPHDAPYLKKDAMGEIVRVLKHSPSGSGGPSQLRMISSAGSFIRRWKHTRTAARPKSSTILLTADVPAANRYYKEGI